MKSILFTVFVFLVSSGAIPPIRTKTWRSNYEYNKKTDAFYNLHIEPVFYPRAKEQCILEGAKLMVPANKEDISQLHGMLKRFPAIGDMVFIGADGLKHESAEEVPLIDLTPTIHEQESPSWAECEVMTRNGDIEVTHCYHRYPFICKVDAKDAPYDEQCKTYAAGYTYVESIKSCYKVPNTALTWNEAYAHCRAEGGHLVVLNSEAEALAVKEFLKTAPRIHSARTTYFFFAGIRADRPVSGPRIFKTVYNETLDEAGYNVWSEGEPNNYDDKEYCGSIFSSNGKYNDVDCSDEYGFVCEIEVEKQT